MRQASGRQEIRALQEQLHTQGSIVKDKRETSNKANEELAKIKEEVATAARSASQVSKKELDESGKEQEVKSDEDGVCSPRVDLKKLFQDVSKDELRKLGFIQKPPEEADNGGSSSRPEGEPDFKKQKMSKPAFDDLLDDLWKASFDGKAQEGEEYDQWIQKSWKSNKFSPY